MAQTDLIVFGNNGCGKSTLCGHILYRYGEFDNNALKKAKAATKTFNKENSEYAFLCNTRDEDRKNGTTTTHMFKLQLSKQLYTLIDACTASKNLNRLIRHGFGQSRIAILILEAYKDNDVFKTLIDTKSDIQNQLLIAHSFGITQIAVCINKIDKDTVTFTAELYNQYKQSIKTMLTSIGYDATKVPIIPICSYSGDNIFVASEDPYLKWWKQKGVAIPSSSINGKVHKITTLMKGIQYLTKKAKALNKCELTLCMSIKSKMEIKNVGTVLLSRVDVGQIIPHQTVLCCKSGDIPLIRKYRIKSLQTHGTDIKIAKCGAVIGFILTPDIDTMDKKYQPKVGDLICNGDAFKISIVDKDQNNMDYTQALPDGIQYHDTFTALIRMISEDAVGKQTLNIDTKTFKHDVVFRTQTLNCSLSRILAKCKKKDNVLEESSGFNELTNDDQAEVVFSTKSKHFVSTYDGINTYARFVVMKDKKAIAIGKVVFVGVTCGYVLNNGLYRFEAVHSKKYITVKDNGKEKGKELVQYERSGKEDQMFYIKKHNNGYTVQCKDSGLYWSIEGASKDDHAKLVQSEYDGSDNQLFEITHFDNSKYSIKAKHSQKSLDITGGSKENDVQIIQYTTHNGPNQLFFCVH